MKLRNYDNNPLILLLGVQYHIAWVIAVHEKFSYCFMFRDLYVAIFVVLQFLMGNIWDRNIL